MNLSYVIITFFTIKESSQILKTLGLYDLGLQRQQSIGLTTVDLCLAIELKNLFIVILPVA